MSYRRTTPPPPGKKSRPGFEKLLEAVEGGSAQVVIAWALDRLTRNQVDTVRLIEACQQHGVTIALVRGSDMDMSTSSGRMVADILASVARQEIETKSEKAEAAPTCKPPRMAGGSPAARPFGYTADGMTFMEPEAQAVRDAYQWLLDGASLGQIARRWNAAGLYTPQGGHEWSGATVGTCLRKPRNAGIREYQGEHSPRDLGCASLDNARRGIPPW